MVYAACRHVALVFAIMHLYSSFFFPLSFLNFILSVCVHSCFIFFPNLVWINQTAWSTMAVCPSLLCSFNTGNIEGTNSSKMCVYMYVLFYVCVGTGFCGLTRGKVILYERNFNCEFARDRVRLSRGEPVRLTGR